MKTKNPLAVSTIFLMISIITFSNFISSSDADEIRNVVILQLLATGMLLGVTITMIIMYFRNK